LQRFNYRKLNDKKKSVYSYIIHILLGNGNFSGLIVLYLKKKNMSVEDYARKWAKQKEVELDTLSD